MGVKSLEEFHAYQLAVEFKRLVYAIVRAHPEAEKDLRYRSQLFEAAMGVESDIAEGWRRYGAGEICQFLCYGLGSLEEAKKRLRDGVHRGYFTEPEIREALTIGNRCGAATMSWWKSLQPFTKKRLKKKPRTGTPQRRGPKNNSETEPGEPQA